MYTYSVMKTPAGRSYLRQILAYTGNSHCKRGMHEYSPKRRCSETHCASDIHGISENIERKSTNISFRMIEWSEEHSLQTLLRGDP